MTAGRATDFPINRRYLAPRASSAGSIRPLGPPAQVDVLRSCVFLRKYYQKLTISLGGYPRGYITEPRRTSFRPSARPQIYLRTYPRVYSWTTPGFVPGSITGPTRGPIPGPGSIPTASAVALARQQPECGGSATPKATILTRTHPPERGRSQGMTPCVDRVSL